MTLQHEIDCLYETVEAQEARIAELESERASYQARVERLKVELAETQTNLKGYSIILDLFKAELAVLNNADKEGE